MVTRKYPRKARVAELLREVVADELERLEDQDGRLGLLTVTGVLPDPDLRHAKVLLSSLPDDVEPVLEGHRKRLQAAIGRQARLKRTPLLSFEADPAVSAGERVEELIRRLGTAATGVGGPLPAEDGSRNTEDSAQSS